MTTDETTICGKCEFPLHIQLPKEDGVHVEVCVACGVNVRYEIVDGKVWHPPQNVGQRWGGAGKAGGR